jgi:propanol-preferring alcohol dehydrogenase
MVLRQVAPVAEGPGPLCVEDIPIPVPGPGELLLRVSACGVCHTELDVIEGRTPPPILPVVPGHQVVGTVAALGPGVTGWRQGERAGVAWIFSACGECIHCRTARENLCARFRATGRDADGGYAEHMVVPAGFAHAIPDSLSDLGAAPLLCAGAVGYRSLRLAGLRDGQALGLTGFGASGHLVLKMVRCLFPQTPVCVFARSADERRFALELGAAWAGDTEESPPMLLDRVIDTTPAWRPVTAALRRLAPGGRLVINAIRKEDRDRACLAELDYAADLWLEKEIVSVANVTRRDVADFLAIAAETDIQPEVETYELADANRALRDLKARRIRGAKVLVCSG